MTIMAHRLKPVQTERHLSTAIDSTKQALTETIHRQHSDLVSWLSAIAQRPDGSQQLKALSRQIATIPTPKDVDLSPIVQAIAGMEAPDVGPHFESLGAKLLSLETKLAGTRITEFDVIREPINGLIEKIVVTES